MRHLPKTYSVSIRTVLDFLLENQSREGCFFMYDILRMRRVEMAETNVRSRSIQRIYLTIHSFSTEGTNLIPQS